MGDGRRTDRVVRDARTKGSELRSTAATKGSELRSTAATKGSELRSTAATKGRTAASRGAEIGRNMKRLDVPWARCRTARLIRESILQFGLAPLMDVYTRRRVFGREHLRTVPFPVVFVANHSSHLDTPTILRALPLKWRQRTAVAAAADYFYKKRAVANAVALIFNTVPLQRGGGAGAGSIDHVDRLIEQRWNLLMFPEGTRSRDGHLGKMRSGAAVIAQQHSVPIVPIYVKGTHDAMPPGRNWPRRVKHRLLSRRHRVEVHIGSPVWVGEDEHRSAVMGRLREFLEHGNGNGDGQRRSLSVT
jgi:1-acyl-sn-glycerol-3-phosphate acyltransferase